MAFTRTKFQLSCAALALTTFLPAQSLAQTQPTGVQTAAEGDERVLSTVIVTSRGREENLQAIPESVTTFSASDIERAGIQTFRDVADLTPNLSQLENFRPGLARIQIRGLITPQVGDPPLAFVVDGITASDLEFINQELFDVERIEVLRGAQGALYGRGAIGGAVKIVTQDPTNDVSGRISAGLANEEYRLSGIISGPIVEDKAFFRLGGYHRDFEGLIDNPILGETVDFVEESSVFGKLLFRLSDQTDLDFRARYTTTDSGLGYYQNVSADTFENFNIPVSHNVPGLDTRDLTELNARIEHNFDFATLELVAGYSESDQSAFSDADYSAVPSDFVFHFAGAQENILKVESSTFEGRLTSRDDGRLRWAFGAFYQDRARDSTFNNYDDPVGDLPQRRSDFDASQIVFSILDDNQSEAWALSAQLNYDLTEKLEITGALRYDSDDRSSVDVRDPAATAASETFEELQPKVSLAYQATEDLLIYGGYSRGFRSGGFNEFSPLIQRVFEKEVSDSFELGFKSSLANGLFTLNGAAFLIDQEDAQVTRFNIDSFTLENISVDEARSQGFELELSARPTDALSLGLSAGIVDSEIEAFDERPDLIGASLPHVADYNVTGTAEYVLPVSSDFDLILRGDVRHTGPRIFNFDVPDIEANNKTFVDLRATLESQAWTFAIYADNVFDERQVEDLFLFADGVTDLARFPNQEPRYGFELTRKF